MDNENIKIIKTNHSLMVNEIELKNIQFAYSIHGNPNATKTVLLIHCFSVNSDFMTWNHDYFKDFDFDEFKVICVNTLGSSHGSTGPTNYESPQISTPSEFPLIPCKNYADFFHLFLQEMSINKIDYVLGSSSGAIHSLALLKYYPELCKNYIIGAIGQMNDKSALMTEFLCTILDENQGKSYNEYVNSSRYSRIFLRLLCAHEKGLATFAKQLRENNRNDKSNLETLKDYYDNDSQNYIDIFGPYSYTNLMRGLFPFQIKDFESSISHFKGKIHFIGMKNDEFMPTQPIVEFINKLPIKSELEITYKEFDTLFGHEGWLLESERFYEITKDYFIS